MDGLLAELTSRQVAEWLAYAQVEPWGEDRADLRAGIVAATVANAFRRQDSRAFTPQDFMPDFAEDEDPDAASARLMAALKAALGDTPPP